MPALDLGLYLADLISGDLSIRWQMLDVCEIRRRKAKAFG